MGSERWDQRYGDRIDKMLREMTGPKRTRPVIWVGPTSFPGENAQRMGARIARLLRERIAAFPGPVFYVDAWAATTNRAGQPKKSFLMPGSRKTLPMRGGDNIHLTAKAVHALLVRPVADLVTRCMNGEAAP